MTSRTADTTPAPLRRFTADGVILDLDGTLLDTAADLAAAVNAMLADLGRPAIAVEQVARFVGKGADVLVHRALTGRPDGAAPEELFDAARRRFFEHYARENGLHAAAYPGVVEGLIAMRAKGLRLAVVTNKPSAFTAPLLERCGLLGYFELLVCGDTVERRKPDPMPMRHVCERFGLAPSRMLAIGDSMNDALAARAAGIAVLAVPYGYNEGVDVQSLDVDAIVDTLYVAAQIVDRV